MNQPNGGGGQRSGERGGRGNQGGGGGQGGGHGGGGGGGGRRRNRHGKNRHGGGGGQHPGQKQGHGQKQGQGQNQQNPNRNQQQNRPQQAKEQKVNFPPVKSRELAPKKFGIIFHETFNAAKADIENIKSMAATVDQLNIVIAEEGNMDEPTLSAIGRVFAGAAWTLIHKRRVDDGWYQVAQPAGTVIPTVRPGTPSHA